MAPGDVDVSIKIIEDVQISSPAGSVPTTTVPLTYFDIPWFPCSPMRSLFFYEYPHPTSHFMQTTLPILKQSLSLALQHFFPLEAKIMCPPPPLKPYILHTDDDSVLFTVAESTADVKHLKADYPRDTKLLHPYAPQLPSSTTMSDGILVLPIMAFQVTVFSNAGVCIGMAHNHVAADGCSFMHFVRSWSSLCKSNGDPTTFLNDVSRQPFHNRDAIKDPAGCINVAMKGYWHWLSSRRVSLGPIETTTNSLLPVDDKVRATFILTRAQILRIKQWLTTQCKEELQMSAFVVTSSIMWICMIKSQDSEILSANSYDDDNFYYFLFAVDCRSRVEFPLPETYFGNCLAPGVVRAKKGEIMGENGMVTAAKAIARKVKEMENEALKEVEKGPSNLEEMFRSEHFVGISGSPKLRMYDADFGWGRPTKIEFTHIDDGGSLSICECRDEPGGMEVSLVLSKDQMDAFAANFAERLKVF